MYTLRCFQTCSGRGEQDMSHNGEKRKIYWVLVRKHDRKRALGKPKNISEFNFKMDLTAAELDDMDYSHGSG